MRCRHCDFPLSPTNAAKYCPRCQMPVGTEGTGKNFALDEQVSFPSMPRTPFPQPGQMWQQMVTPPPAPIVSRPYANAPFASLEAPSQIPDKRTGKGMSSSSNLGFVIAGLCVMTGALLLILVFFLAAGLPTTETQTQAVTNGIPTATVVHHRATPTSIATTPAATAVPTTATGAFPAQQMITTPRMASAVNTNTAQVTSAATTFKVGQRIYVTFAIHPNGQSGAVCLLWYTSTNVFSNFEFAVTPSSTVAYSYTFAQRAGPSYVEIYWSSSVSCSDKMLAQRVNFTVVG